VNEGAHVFSLSYAWNELRRRAGRTIVTAIGLAAGVGLVMGIIGVSSGLSDAQNKVLSPLSTVGTDIIVTRTVAPTTSATTTTTTTPAFGGGGGGAGGAGGGGAFFGRGVAGAASLNSSDDATLASANSSVLTDLAKLGKPGTKFTHDFFVPGTLVTFPSDAITVVSKITGVTSAVGALSLQALHETGTVPTQVATVKTGGQKISTTEKAPVLTAAQQATERSCITNLLKKDFGSTINGTGTGTTPTPTRGTFPGAGGSGTGSSGTSGAPTRVRRTFANFGSNSAFEKCLTPAQITYENTVTVPEQTIRQVLAAPTTNISDTSYTIAGVNPADQTTGLITKAQLVKGTWFTSDPANEVLLATSYAAKEKVAVGGKLAINGIDYTVIGTVNPTLTGDSSDVYFDLSTLQKLSTESSRVNEVLVSVAKSSNVTTVANEIKKALPGATVLTDQTLADQVSGSLSNAHKLANDLGGALAIVVLLAAFLIAGLLTLSSVAKRTREIGSLRAIGWSRGAVVRQIIAETLGIGILGAIIGVGIGVLVCVIIGAVGPGLSVTSSGLSVGASTVSNLIGQSNSATINTTVHLTAPIHASAVILGVAGAILGGLLAGIAGGWRAARLSPASALRDLG
jgi:ABC-type antimicrobial peptide transport system permease subunit